MMSIHNLIRNTTINYHTLTHAAGILTAVFFAVGMKSEAAGAQLPAAAPVYDETARQTAGWLEANGCKYYLRQDTGQMAAGWLP